jgi:hypothetical protein
MLLGCVQGDLIWLFKVDEVFWGDKPKVNEFYTFDTDYIDFDITQYDISLYFGTASYYMMSESNEDEIYYLRLVSVNGNPVRVLVSDDSEIYNVVRDFYLNKK